MNVRLGLEHWLAFSSLGLSIMFILLILSFYNFLIGPQGTGPDRFVDIQGVLIKTISISGAPSLILSGIIFGLCRQYGSKLAGLLLSVSGLVLIVGMILSITLAYKINAEFFQISLIYVPYVFMFSGIGILIIGIILYKKSDERILESGGPS